MVLGSRSEPLSHLEVLVVDCQATAAAPRGHLLEIGWARVRDTVTDPHAYLIALPDGAQISPTVSRITGISQHMMRAGVDRQFAWRALSDQAATLTQQPAPTVIHFAQFEHPFLRTLASGVCPLDVVCTRDIARRLLPNLPRCSLRALLVPDEIKPHRPPYNVALTVDHRTSWFASPDLSARSREPSPHCPFGPIASTETLSVNAL